MFGKNDKIEHLLAKTRRLDYNVSDIYRLMQEMQNTVKRMNERLKSRPFKDLVDQFEKKEKRLYKEVVEIITTEKPVSKKVDIMPYYRLVKYKNLVVCNGNAPFVRYKGFEFDKETAKELADLETKLNGKNIIDEVLE